MQPSSSTPAALQQHSSVAAECGRLVARVEHSLAQLKVLTKVFLAHIGIIGKLLCCAAYKNASLVEQICPVCNGKGLVHIVVCYDYANVFGL